MLSEDILSDDRFKFIYLPNKEIYAFQKYPGGLMLSIRKANSRGQGDHGWLKTFHTFSFADYHDPNHMHFRSLRVINEDYIQGGYGFSPHPHRDMEIITYVIKGALAHKDSMGNQAVIYPGEVQKMSAGTGIVHSEFNHQKDQETHLFQIWILPKSSGGKPNYGQKSFAKAIEQDGFVLVTSESGRQGSISIGQDADLYVAKMRAGDKLEFDIRPNRGVWLQLVSGQISVNGEDLSSSDGLAIEEIRHLHIQASADTEFLLFDLA